MSGRIARIVCTASLAAAALTAPPPAGAAADPVADRPPVSELLTRMRTLYVQAEEATEAYNATEERLRAERKRSGRLDRELRRARGDLAAGRATAGRIAREQYRDTVGLSATVRSVLSGDPRRVSDRRHELRRAADRQSLAVLRMERSERRADRAAGRARASLEKRRALTERRKKQRDRVAGRLRAIERALASLSEDELRTLRQRERRQTATAQRALVSAGTFRRAGRAPSQAGDRALRYALQQIGKPYAWGAEGPDSFDCSGLTSQAWAHAGHPIPRTSQEQWRKLPRVPLDQVRPGDLVVYYPKATHVAIYAGDGMVVQAPRPGSTVKVSPLASNPPIGAVRPDAGSPPLAGYVPPRR
ncbi:C40 family peptidase [Streptomyces pactum]|uniref:C40 family peptidase n=1 Tax=Streptomyces pactum TaxID=68249 RepID=A0ABS0NP43_9ACTN|nr:C40 family peptidase [Streptomyces pactum]MBH5336975.1 C40 family peptidase [Streptomyces pactum]